MKSETLVSLSNFILPFLPAIKDITLDLSMYIPTVCELLVTYFKGAKELIQVL